MAHPVEVFVEGTPNPHSMKFTLNRKVIEKGSKTYNGPQDPEAPPVVKALFEIPGVKSLFFLNDFITVSRDPSADWGEIVPKAQAAIRAHFS